MIIVSLLLIAFGFMTISITFWHEWTWYRRQRNCLRIVGRIISEVEDTHDDTTRWKIEYEPNGVARQFISGYGGSSTMQVGDDANVIIDLESNNAEHFTWSNRWVFTVAPILLGIAFFWGGISIIRLEEVKQNNPLQRRYLRHHE